jgi:hypothetical protein
MNSSATEEVCANSLQLASRYIKERNFARAFSHFLVHFKLKKNRCEELDSATFGEFLEALRELADRLELKECHSQMRQAFRWRLSLKLHSQHVKIAIIGTLEKHRLPLFSICLFNTLLFRKKRET